MTTLIAAGCQLVTAHNICYVLRLMRKQRAAILDGTYPQFVRSFMAVHFAGAEIPTWVMEACAHAGIELQSPCGTSAADSVESDTNGPRVGVT